MTARAPVHETESPVRDLVDGGWRVVALRFEPRCLCCQNQHVVNRWLLLRKQQKPELDGVPVTMNSMQKMSLERLGVNISAASIAHHQRHHIDVVRDTMAADLVIEPSERVRLAAKELAGRDRSAPDEAMQHIKLLEDIVRIGRAVIEADPTRVTVDHAVAAAKELARINQDETKSQLLRALAAASSKPQVGPVEVEVIADAEVVGAIEAMP